MDDSAFTQIAVRLGEVNKLIEGLDPTIRTAAFALFQDYVTHGVAPNVPSKRATNRHTPVGHDREAFFSRFDNGKPADNALLLAGYHYAQYGSEAFLLSEMEDLADEVGITIPERLDKTLLVATRKGKTLFRRVGKGAFQPTVHGEAYFKTTYEVTKGTHAKSAAEAETGK